MPSTVIIITPPEGEGEEGGRSAAPKATVKSVTIEFADGLSPNEIGHEVARILRGVERLNGAGE
jgi:hypothetical protein